MAKPEGILSKNANGIADSEDPDQTAQEQSDLGLHCLPRPICQKTLDHYGNDLFKVLSKQCRSR